MKHCADKKRTSHKARHGLPRKAPLIITLAVMIVIVGVIAAYAALRDTTGTVTETLETAEVTCTVNSDWSVTNTSNIPALIRVRVVINKTAEGEIIPGDVPAYTVGSGWTKIGEYLYYNGILTESGGDSVTTSASISVTPESDTEVVVLAEAIQAASTAAADKWGVSYSNGSWS